MTKKQTEQAIKLRDVEKLLDGQTSAILSAVDGKLQKTDSKINQINQKVEIIGQRVEMLDKKINKLEIKVDRRFDQLITTLDKFLKRLTDMEDEFAIMKLDINRLKKIIKEKLGVDVI